jgi:serine protease Do
VFVIAASRPPYRLTQKEVSQLKPQLVLAALAALLAGCATLPAMQLGATQTPVLRAKDRVAPALVHVRPVKEVFQSGKREEVSVVGSGFIIAPDGAKGKRYVVTNEHVAGESKFVRCVLFSKEEADATVVGIDKYTDIAVLKLDGDQDKLPYVTLGSSARVKAGQVVLAMGSPHGLARSVSMGIISVTDRYLEDRGEEMVSPFNTWIQTDAAINPGNSGGPLVNLQGEVIGINARVLAGAENVGFAIPIDIAREVIDKIIKDGRVSRSWFGETLQPTRAKTDDPAQKGVVIADVDPLSPGYEAGLRPGDVMLAIDGAPTNARYEEDLPAVRKRIADIPVGMLANVSVLRGGKEIEIPVTTIERSLLKGNQVEFSEWGFTAVDMNAAMVRRAQLPSKKGILITGSQNGGIAANARLQAGDIILSVDQADVADLDAFQILYKGLVESQKPLVMLQVKRGALTRFVLVKQGEDNGPQPDTTSLESEGGSANVN